MRLDPRVTARQAVPPTAATCRRSGGSDLAASRTNSRRRHVATSGPTRRRTHAAAARPPPEWRAREVLSEYVREARAGRAPDTALLLARHADLSAELAPIFADARRLDELTRTWAVGSLDET